MLKVMEIFHSIQGEGVFSGLPTTFIRFAGCTVGCPKCDTVPSWKAKNKIGPDAAGIVTPALIEEVMSVCPTATDFCVTGGEPLEQDNEELADFMHQLMLRNRHTLHAVSVETSGAYPISNLKKKLARWNEKLSWSVDYKPPSTKATNKMVWSTFLELTPRDGLKFVCLDVPDYEHCVGILQRLTDERVSTNVFFHSMGGMADRWLAELILKDGLAGRFPNFTIRYGIQLHKLLQFR